MPGTLRQHRVQQPAGSAPCAGCCRVARPLGVVSVFLALGLAVFSPVSPAAVGQVYLALDGGVQAGDFGTPVRYTLI